MEVQICRSRKQEFYKANITKQLPVAVKRNMIIYSGQLYARKFYIFQEMNNFLEKHYLELVRTRKIGQRY